MRVLRGRVEGPGRVLCARIEAPRLGGADAAGRGGEVFSLCAWLGRQFVVGGYGWIAARVFFPWAVYVNDQGQVGRAGDSGWG